MAFLVDLQTLHGEELTPGDAGLIVLGVAAHAGKLEGDAEVLAASAGRPARSSVEKLKLGVTIDVTMPFSWLAPAMPERKASVWKTLSVFWLNVVMPELESEYASPMRATPRRRKSLRSASLVEIVTPLEDWL